MHKLQNVQKHILKEGEFTLHESIEPNSSSMIDYFPVDQKSFG